MSEADAASPVRTDLDLSRLGDTPSGRARRWPWPMRAIAARLFAHVRIGRLTIVSPGGDALSSPVRAPGPDGILVLHRWRTLRRLLLGGDVAFGEAYLDGDWSSPDVAALIEMAALNDGPFRDTVSGSQFARLLNRLVHLRRPNTPRGSSRNILAHYDLGNAFYEGWLDRSMQYSSGLYRTGDETLERAQELKLDRLVEALDLDGGERVLEIGCGWGALAERLGRLGCRVTAVTISRAQFSYARDRMVAAGLADRVEIRLEDYRDVRGTFDRIVSVEMIEAVGRRYWPVFFRTIRDRLAPGGAAVVQAITIADTRFAMYATTPDFIQVHVFPGGMLPSPSILERTSGAAGLTIETVERFGASYARTLRAWRARPTAAPAGHGCRTDVRFQRLWEYYLAYCEGGFRSGATDVGIYRLAAAAS